MNLLIAVAAYTSAGLLLLSGGIHWSHFPQLRSTLAQHSLWPRGSERHIAVAVVSSELTLGGIGVSALATSTPDVSSPTLGGVALVYAAFAVYSMRILRVNPRAPCGCTTVDTRINVWVPLRALFLMICALLAFVESSQLPPAQLNLGFALVVIASVTFVVIAWALPGAMHNPLRPARQEVSV